MLTGLTSFFERFPGTNKTVMPLKLSKAPLQMVLDNICKWQNKINIINLYLL